jgi:hypothetical protein
MRNIKSILAICLMMFVAFVDIEAKEGPKNEAPVTVNKNTSVGFRADCVRPTRQIDMQVNNVRSRLLVAGNLWEPAGYVVPKPAPGELPVSSIYSGGVWIGGVDKAQNKKISAVTYQSSGYDFFAGPLDLLGATEQQTCEDWDRFFVVKGLNIRNHYNNFRRLIEVNPGGEVKEEAIPDDVKYWPGKGNKYWRNKYNFQLPDQELGAFWDENLDGIYNPNFGDFPIIDIRGCEPVTSLEAIELVPDEMVFFIYNDNGGPQTLTGTSAIQMEVQVQAFAYSTNDEINDMSFYRYKLINKASDDIVDCYFAMWIDPDLGCYQDDYIGCDVSRSMAYVYNQDAVDGINGTACGGTNTYGNEVPILGMDYFRGPLGPKVFKKDSITGALILDGDGKKILLEPKPFTGDQDTIVELGMTSFTYTENEAVGDPLPGTTDPQARRDDGFYNLLRGLWPDGTAVTYGGSGYNPGSTDTVKYVFPDDPNNPSGWSMCHATPALPFGDRRTLQATGPLLLQPSATNELIIGVVFVPDITYPCPDITRLKFADDIAQALFDNCFDITDGPDAPDLTSVELDKEIIIMLSNETTSNNFGESYNEKDLQAPNGVDNTYKFEGYRIYQLVDAGVTPQELSNIEKARPIATIDVKNGIREIYNWRGETNPLDPIFGPTVWTPTKMVTGNNTGVINSIRVTEDQFALSDRRLINHKQYYFLAVAYAYNNWKPFDIIEGTGQRRAYLEGRGNVGGIEKRPYTFVPRPIVYDRLNAAYGEGATVTRISGEGNPGVFLELEDGMREAMLAESFDGKIKYKNGLGPISAKVVDPLRVKNGKYRLEITGDFDGNKAVCAYKDAKWKLTNVTDPSKPQVLLENIPLSFAKEHILKNLGVSVTLSAVEEPGVTKDATNGGIDTKIEYKDPAGPKWFNTVTDGGAVQFQGQANNIPVLDFVRNYTADPANALSKLGDGSFVPFLATKYERDPDLQFFLTPAARDLQALMNSNANQLLRLRDLNNVDIVFTKDKTKWSKCMVVETNTQDYVDAGYQSEGNVKNFFLRSDASVGTDGKSLNDGTKGFSYFPGYAVDVETGKRLNIFFGENSVYGEANVESLDGNVPLGGDMIFNPSAQLISSLGGIGQLVAGGQHYIYVTREEYDGCAKIAAKLSATSPIQRIKGSGSVTWCAFPFGVASAPLLPIEQGLIPNDVVVKLRVSNPYGESRAYNVDKEKDCVTDGDNPVYEFEFTGKEAEKLTTQEEYKGALANVNVVPNPYYAYSSYETSQFTNTIKITNLPERAVVTIYSIDGNFIRQYNRDERGRALSGVNRPTSTTQVYPDLEWDMKNFKDIPVASGVYLIHISAPELGEERTIKWFGIGRQFDPSGL